MSVVYVILHYKNMADTVKCVESLRRTAAPDSRFVIVDNGSGDGSGDRLAEQYASLCTVLRLPENVGFSKGNNAGYRYARETFHPQFIVVTNNDVVFDQPDFEEKIRQLYEETSFDVLGPDVYVPRHNDHQSPLFRTGITEARLERELEEYRRYEQHPNRFRHRLRIHAFKNRLCSNCPPIRRAYAALRGKDDLDYRRSYENVGLQGACLIFSPHFLENEEKAFDPEPFLYEEEVFLFYRCRRKGYKLVYSPAIAIRHEEAASFRNANRNSGDRLRFMLHHHVAAREMLLAYLRKEENG